MYTVIGSGFGLYGYLPAIIDTLDESIVLPESYRKVISSRPELLRYDSKIKWVPDQKSALTLADAAVIATPPIEQLPLVQRCLLDAGIKKFVLEKPLAADPIKANQLLDFLELHNCIYRIGYSFLYTRWYENISWPYKTDSPVYLKWYFMAHHFKANKQTWKRKASAGGGVLKFFGIHIIAMLAALGYTKIVSSRLSGQEFDEPDKWVSKFTSPELPDFCVNVDSRSNETIFHISQSDDFPGLSLDDPFEEEVPVDGNDRRIHILGRLLNSFENNLQNNINLYRSINLLWNQAESFQNV